MDDDESRSLASLVRSRREALGLTISELARLADLPISNISHYEQGLTKLPGPEKRRKLAAALGVPHVALFVAAGELTPEEARGALGPPELSDRTPQAQLARLALALTDKQAESLLAMIAAWGGGGPIAGGKHRSAPAPPGERPGQAPPAAANGKR